MLAGGPAAGALFSEQGSFFSKGDPFYAVGAGGYLYVLYRPSAFGAPSLALEIFDVTDPLRPVSVGGLPEAGTEFLKLHGTTLFASEGDELTAYDVSDPTTPALLDSIPILGDPKDVAFSGTLAYVASEDKGVDDGALTLVDISNPASMSVVGSLPYASGVASVEVQGSIAYIALSSSVKTVDVSVPATPVEVGSVSGANWVTDMVAAGSYLYGVGAERLHTFDVSNSLSPALLDTTLVSGARRSIRMQGSRLFLGIDQGSATGGLAVFETSNPALPAHVTTFDTASEGYAQVSLDGTTLYLTQGSKIRRIALLDISNPDAPSFISSLSGMSSLHDIAFLDAETAIWATISRLVAVNVARPDAPVPYAMNSWSTYPIQIDTEEGLIVSAGSHGAFAHQFDDAFGFTRLSDFEVPYESGDAFPSDVVLRDGLAYISMEEAIRTPSRGLVVWDLSDPSSPSPLGTALIGTSSLGVSLWSHYAYVRHTSEISIVDVSDPNALVEKGTYVHPTPLWEVEAGFDHVYATTYANELLVIDVSNPMSPFLVTTISDPSLGVYLRMQGRTLYVGGSASGIQTFGLQNPASPRWIADDSLTASGRFAVDCKRALGSDDSSSTGYEVFTYALLDYGCDVSPVPVLPSAGLGALFALLAGCGIAAIRRARTRGWTEPLRRP